MIYTKPILFVVLICTCLRLNAQQNLDSTNFSNPENLSIKLVTIDPGDDLTSWWGHTAIVVEDTVLRQSRFYNFGLFSFEQENFILNFLQGRLIFWVGDWDTGRALLYYRSLNRSIRIQYLNLSPQKRQQMAELLIENVRPENREYLYDHYLDNCATRVRDLVDIITDGAFAEQMKIPGRMTFREHTRRHTARNIFIDWILMFLMHDGIDKPIQRWDEMFLPTELERAVADFVYTDAAGQPVPFVSHTSEFYSAREREPVPETAAVHAGWALVLCIIIGGLLYVFLTKFAGSQSILALSVFGTGILFGVPGLILFSFSTFTDHTVTYGNENLLLANPLTFLLLIFAVGLFFKTKPFMHWTRLLMHTITGLAWLGLILKILPIFDQDNWLAIATILPILTAYSLFFTLKKSDSDS